jgi:hypothetical protein
MHSTFAKVVVTTVHQSIMMFLSQVTMLVLVLVTRLSNAQQQEWTTIRSI